MIEHPDGSTEVIERFAHPQPGPLRLLAVDREKAIITLSDGTRWRYDQRENALDHWVENHRVAVSGRRMPRALQNRILGESIAVFPTI